MGSIFPRTLVVLALAAHSASASGQILLPKDPTLPPPPRRSQESIKQDQKQREETLEQDLKEAGLSTKPVPDKPQLKRDLALLEETLKPTPLDFALLTHLTYSHITTSGNDRSDYGAEPSVGINIWYRIFQDTKPEDTNIWAGFRGQYFGGSGRYKQNSGTFSFLYFGPTIGVGKISPGVGDVGQDATKDADSVAKALTARHGLFALTGIAAQSRQGTHEPDKNKPDDDLNSKALAFDSPGLFAEVWYTHIRYNALSYNALLGAQTGKQKLFIYLGVGVGLWR